ncbi:IS1634 family transposase [Methanocalculus sp.]|uniref:IS1634 family transposase n=1 Tax=Methanocalculus sp. TaxID=2004547 RepID=UPI00261F7440|nr:IS1634 family transposase [Methanocalculus sp.]MDG6251632.1 IS1634 family transposase [Methanocalculus sp.]
MKPTSTPVKFKITYGYPKDGRWDPKRFVLGIAANQHDVPLFLQTISGNESDKETIRTIIQALTGNLKLSDKVYHIANSAFYTEENLSTLGTRTFWMTRVPVTIAQAKAVSQASVGLQTLFRSPIRRCRVSVDLC